MRKPLPSMEELNRIFSYDPESGRLIWRYRPEMDGICRNWNHRWAGKDAGWISNTKSGTRKKVQINSSNFMVHRVIWKMMHGTEPALIDHADGNPFNNRLVNLRSATRAQNMHNRHHTKGRDLPKGVTFCRRKGYQHKVFTATIGYRSKQIYLGTFQTAEAAAMARASAEKIYYGAFAMVEQLKVSSKGSSEALRGVSSLDLLAGQSAPPDLSEGT